MRTQVLGLGSYVPDRIVTNDELRHLDVTQTRHDDVQMETNDEWVQTRTGIRERRYAAPGVATSDLALAAAQRALADAGCEAKDLDCIIFGTLSPDIHFPGSAVFLQHKLGIAEGKGKSAACFDIRQQCSAFVYGMQMADAFIRAGMYRRVLLVGAELHSHCLDYTTRGRDVTVLFGDGAGAMVLGPLDSTDPRAGIAYTDCHADGSGAMNLHLKIFNIDRTPYFQDRDDDPSGAKRIYPQMDGKRVFLNAVRNMVISSAKALTDAGMTWDDIDWFVPHQANLRINEKVVEVGKIPAEKVLNTIQFYGNTTAATVPLTIDHWRQQGKVKKGDRILSTVFGAGFTWGSAIFQV